MPADQVTFQATLEDNVSPNLEKLEKQLKEMGQSPVQIKMILQAVDQASPKIKQAQEHLNKLPKEHKIHLNLDFKSGIDAFTAEMKKAKSQITKPITMPFKLVDDEGNRLSDTLRNASMSRQQLAGPIAGGAAGALGGIVPGAGSLVMGAAGGGAVIGAIEGLTQVMEDSIKQNIEMEQAHQKLSIALRDTSGATVELNKVIAANVKSPFTFQQTLQADVLARSFQAPVFAGENKNVPKGYLQTASNMAAAMGTTPDDAMMAIAMARQHMYRRLQLFGIRMTAGDFGPSGRFAGMSVDQALNISTRRFQGAMAAQMKTLPGMLSNIKDVTNAQIIRPIGQNIFGALESKTGGLADSLASDTTKKKIGEAVQQIQHLTLTVLRELTKIHQYFDLHLKQPLEDIIAAIKSFGQTFIGAFGGGTAVALKTFSEAIMSITTPLASIVKDVPMFGTLLGYMKAMQMAGLGGMVKPIQTLKNALDPRSSQGLITGIFKAIGQVPGMLIKTAGFLVIKDILDAHKASTDLNNQFKNMHGNMDGVNKSVAEMAYNLGESETHMKNLVAAAAQGIPTGRLTPNARATLAEQMGSGAVQLGNKTGWDMNQILATISSQMKAAGTYTVDAFHDMGTQFLEAAAVAKQFGYGLSDVLQIIQTFSKQAGPIGLGGMQGAPALMALSTAGNAFGVTHNQLAQGLYTPDTVNQTLLGQYGAPTIDALKKVPQGQLGDFWNFRSRPGKVQQYGQNEALYQKQALAAQKLQTSSRSTIAQIAPTALEGPYKVPKTPVLWNSEKLATDFKQFNQGNPEQQAEKVKKAWADTVANWQKAVQTIARYQAQVDQTQNKLDQFNQAQASVNLQLQAFQHLITLQQRVIEDASLKLQQYTFDNLRPLERELTRVQNAMDVMNHTMSDAQYNMTKFADGLLTGEQAALNQLHALSLYNEQLNYLKLQYTQIGAQLGTTVYTRGYSARVQPLMGLSLEMQMQQLERKQQLAQSKYDITYGEGHYQMQQAQRSVFQKTEMPLNQRLKGINASQKAIDTATISLHNVGQVQFALQEKMFKVNEAIANQQDHITKLQLNLTAMQQSSTMRRFEDEQFHLGQKIGQTNIELTKQNKIMDQWQNTVDDLNQKKQDLQSLFDSMLVFDGKGPKQFKEAISAVHLAGQSGLLPGGHWETTSGLPRAPGHMGGHHATRTWVPGKEEQSYINSINQAAATYKQAQKTSVKWYDSAATWQNKLKEVLQGIFTGDTWKKLGEISKNIPILGPSIASLLNSGSYLAPIVTAVSALLFAGGTFAYGVKKFLAKALPNFITDIKLPGMLGGSANTIGEALTKDSFATTIFRKFEPFIHPLKLWRTSLGRGVGAALGFLVGGGPVGAVVGGLAGGHVGSTWESRRDNAFTKAADELRDMPRNFGNKIKDFGKETDTFAGRAAKAVEQAAKTAAEEGRTALKNVKATGVFEEAISEKKGFGKFVKVFGDEGKKFATAITKFEGIKGAIHTFSSATNKFSNSVSGITEWLGKHLPGAGPGKDAKVALSEAERLAATGRDAAKINKEAESNPVIKKIIQTAGEHGLKWVEIGGKILKIAARGVGAFAVVTSAVPVVQDILKGKYGKAAVSAANAGSYFVPVLGEIRVLADIVKGIIDIWPQVNHPTIAKQGAILGGAGSGILQANQNLGNVYAGQALDLQNLLKHGRLTKQQYAQDLKQLIEARLNMSKVDTAYNNLDIQHKGQYQKLTQDQQTLAQAAALTGPNGLQSFLDNQKNVLVDHWNHRLKHVANSFNSENSIYNDGYKNIAKTSAGWLKELSKQIDAWSKNMGIPLTKGEKKSASAGFSAAAQTSATVTASLSNWAHGGVLHDKDHNVGKGRIVRVNEEGYDEMIIPLAPHRRDRAKSLVKQTKAIIGYAHGGISHADEFSKDWSPRSDQIGAANRQIHGIWSKLSSMKSLPSWATYPEHVFKYIKSGRGFTESGPQGHRRIDFPLDLVTQLLNPRDREHAWSLNTVIHEMAHTMQSPMTWYTKWMAEGGATAWTDQQLAKGWHMGEGQLVPPGPEYAAYENKVISQKGWGWIDHNQFTRPGYAAGGRTSKDAILRGLPPAVRRKEKYNLTDILPGYASGGRVSDHGTTRLARIVQVANQIASKHFPYLWGGGHSPDTMGGPYDCSGAVSALLRGAGYFSPGEAVVSGWFDNQFLPGPGAVSIFSNPTHVYTDIEGRGWGTSGANPGGGAGWFAGGARPGFSVHHLPGLDKSVSPGQLSAWIKAVGSGGSFTSNVTPIDLKKVPKSLQGMGLIGAAQFAILEEHRKKWISKLNEQATQSSSGGNFAGGALGNPGTVSSRFSGSQKDFITTLASLTGLSPRVVGAWVAAEEPVGASSGYRGTQDWLNVGITDSTAASGGLGAGNSAWGSGASAARATAAWIKGTWNDPGFGFASSGIRSILNSVGRSPSAQISAIANSGWASSGYNGGSTLTSLYNQGYMGGLRRVPHDNFRANLHQDEMIVPAAVANAARAHAGGGMMGRYGKGKVTLKNDTAWSEFYDKFKHIHDSILLLQVDIHKTRLAIEKDKSKADKTRDTDLLAKLNAQLRAQQTAYNAAQAGYGRAIRSDLRSVNDQSGGENTLKGVTEEKARRAKIIYTIVTKDRTYIRAQEKLDAAVTKLHKDVAKYNKDRHHYDNLNKRVHRRGHHETSAEKKELEKIRHLMKRDRRRIRHDRHEVKLDRHSLAEIKKALERKADFKYLVGAATRGVNAGLLKAITGHALSKKQEEAYKKLEKATRDAGAHTTKAEKEHIEKLKQALKKSLEISSKKSEHGHKHTKEAIRRAQGAIDHGSHKQMGGHHKTHKHLKDIHGQAKHHYSRVHNQFSKDDAHIHRHTKHMDKTEKHQKEMEKKMDSLLRKDLVVNITNKAEGAIITTTRSRPRRRAR